MYMAAYKYVCESKSEKGRICNASNRKGNKDLCVIRLEITSENMFFFPVEREFHVSRLFLKP